MPVKYVFFVLYLLLFLKIFDIVKDIQEKYMLKNVKNTPF